ncbi:uncharacterized protein LOC131060707 isoform X2 [Cryptomeria japonica]|uniref:uncharacterized protein LOC131060707 isoform X2 n=1 Tax=Cryptomeria japonica TaxID=3369 RepID=UPI0025ACD1BA|nr:uncharacterized protein LOC131060707 isoform X2 [Cryptomeria japonica]
MMPCLSASRGYRPSPFSSPTSTTCSSSCAVVSDTKSTSISSSGSEISSLVVPQKKARTRRKRPQQMYNEAAAALSAIYPKIFSQRNCGPHRKKIDSKVWKKIEPLRFKEVGAPELLSQEVPTLIGRVREVEETELLYNEGIPPELKCGIGDQSSRRQVSRLVENDSDDSKFKSLSLSEVEVDVSSPSSYDSGGSEYKCFLESSDGDIDGGIMSSIMGSDANPETEDGFGVFGFVQGTEYNLQSSAIRALRRTSDSMVCPVFDYSFPRLKLSDRSMTEERNTVFFSSLDLLKRDDYQHRLKLQLNYEDVINAWSDRGPLYTVEVQDPQMVPDDSYSDPMVQFTHTYKSTLAES